MDSTYDCKIQQNATLTGQELQGDVQLKVTFLALFCYILTFGLFQFMAGEFRRLIPFGLCEYYILTHTTYGPPVVPPG